MGIRADLECDQSTLARLCAEDPAASPLFQRAD
jgi:hypothetical protein